MKFVLIPAGSFQMGSKEEKFDDMAIPANERPAHTVEISRPFYMGVFEVTQEEWETVMGNNPSVWKNSKIPFPVQNVSWLDCQEFLKKLSEKHPGSRFRLPTEAEWEYACRAGTTTAYSWGDGHGGGTITFAWYALPGAFLKPNGVGKFPPNAWGLYDMHGNVAEWCADWCGWDPTDSGGEETDYTTDKAVDPKGPAEGKFRAARGGAYNMQPQYCRSSYRIGCEPSRKGGNLGFRVVKDTDPR
jgi:formylglycine-generating enzyme required for sulfatase activity